MLLVFEFLLGALRMWSHCFKFICNDVMTHSSSNKLISFSSSTSPRLGTTWCLIPLELWIHLFVAVSFEVEPHVFPNGSRASRLLTVVPLDQSWGISTLMVTRAEENRPMTCMMYRTAMRCLFTRDQNRHLRHPPLSHTSEPISPYIPWHPRDTHQKTGRSDSTIDTYDRN